MAASPSNANTAGASATPDNPRVVWTRGSGCSSLASSLGDARRRKADGDLRTVCIETRADLLVTKRLTSFDLINVAVPHHFVPAHVKSVAAAVAGGPHSSLAARIAGLLAANLDVPGRVVIASSTITDDGHAEAALAALPPDEFDIPRSVVRAATAKALIESLAPGTLLVLGAPGGSWMQRQFFGPGRKLLYSAPAGAVIVRSAPRRCFQAAEPAVALGTPMRVRDAEYIVGDRLAVPVAEAGRLVGIVRAESLVGVSADTTVGAVMEAPVFLHVDDPIDDIVDVARFLAGGAVPIVDRDGGLFGVVAGAPIADNTDGSAALRRGPLPNPAQ